MTIYKITPDKITKLFGPETAVRNDAEPGIHLSSYPYGPAKGEGTPDTRESENNPNVIVLSDPVPLSEIDAATPYVIKDTYGRVLSVDGAGSGAWQWAYTGQYGSYPADVFPISFSANPENAAAWLTAHINGTNWSLYSNGTSTSWEYTFWASSTYGDGNYTKLSLKATKSGTRPDFFSLAWKNNGTDMDLKADSGSWNYLWVSSTSFSEFSARKFYVDRSKVNQLFKSTWPSASLSYAAFNTADQYYQAISEAQASGIYTDSGLSGYTWKPESFDCDDFSYVYKAQASKDAWSKNADFGYSVGVIFGNSPSVGHAANIFIDTSGAIKILEPQNGRIVSGKDWKDKDGKPYSPYFILM